jgi:hypothetical protein
MRDQSASLLIGTLADQALEDLRTGRGSDRGRLAAKRLQELMELVIAFRSGEISSARPDPEVSASAAHSLLATAALRLGVLREGLGGLVRYRELLQALGEGRLDADGRLQLEPFLAILGNWSAEAAEARLTAFLPEQGDRRRRSWTDQH